MRTAEKVLAVLLLAMFLVAMINHGTIALSSGPKGASFSTGYSGLTV